MAPFNFSLKSIEIDKDKVLEKRGLDKSGEVQQFIDGEVLRYCDPYVPMDNGGLIKSGTLHTVIGSGEVRYRTPYARRWYYMPAEFQGKPKRGNYWFERMKNEGGKEKILNGVVKLTGGRGIV